MAGFLPQLVDRTHGTLLTVLPHGLSRFGSSWFGEPRLLLGSVFEPTSLSQTTPTALDWENVDVDEREGDPWRSLLPSTEIHTDFLTLTEFLDQRGTWFAEAEVEITEAQSSRVNHSSSQPETLPQSAPPLPQRSDESAGFDPSVSKTSQPESLLPPQKKTQEAVVQRRDRPTFPLVSSASPNSPSIPQNRPLEDLTTSKTNSTVRYPLASPSISENSTVEHLPNHLSSKQLPALPLQITPDLPSTQVSVVSSPTPPIPSTPPVPLSSSSPHSLTSSVSQPLSHITGSTEAPAPISLNRRSEITTTHSDLRLDMRDSMLRSPLDAVRQPQIDRLEVNLTSSLPPLNLSVTPHVVARSEPSLWQANIASRDRQNPELKTVSGVTSMLLPTIEISIGRIEVRIKSAETTVPKSQTRSTARRPQVSLSDYLQNRNGQTEGGST